MVVTKHGKTNQFSIKTFFVKTNGLVNIISESRSPLPIMSLHFNDIFFVFRESLVGEEERAPNAFVREREIPCVLTAKGSTPLPILLYLLLTPIKGLPFSL